MSTNHTPGPWRRHPDNPDTIISGDPAGDMRVVAAFACHTIVGKEERTANVDLCLAAPDLLEALEGLVSAWKCGEGEFLQPQPEFDAARDAIAKAKGATA